MPKWKKQSINIDPTRWLVAIAGFLYDFIMTREWMRVLGALSPVFVVIVVASLVWRGRSLDRGDLANWYMRLGDKEIEAWESAWTGRGTEDTAAKTTDNEETAAEANEDATEENAESSRANAKLTRYANLLFRRVQLLQPNDRSLFIVAANLAQHGQLEEARKMLARVAPEKQSGYAPAHAYMALIYLNEFRRQPSRQLAVMLKHHIVEAKRWDRIPQAVLRAGSDLFWSDYFKDYSGSVELLALAAKGDPAVNLELSKRARATGNERVLEQSVNEAETYFRAQLKEDPRDDKSRVSLADLLVNDDRIDEAEAVLKEGEKFESTDLLKRGFSEIYRIRFVRSLARDESGYTANVSYLDTALRYCPTNERVVEEIARLARIQQGPSATQEMVTTLRQFLAEGKATAATHAWLAEAFLIQNEFEQAIPHLQQVVLRLPNAAQYLNNLAYVTADLYPDRLDEAREYAERAVQAAKLVNRPHADYYDTLGTIYVKLYRYDEAITAFETAIELSPRRQDFHQRAAAAYRTHGNEAMAEMHDKVIVSLIQQEQIAKELIAEEGSVDESGNAEETGTSPTNGDTTNAEPTNAVPTDLEAGEEDSGPAAENLGQDNAVESQETAVGNEQGSDGDAGASSDSQ